MWAANWHAARRSEFVSLVLQLISTQPIERQQQLESCFTRLMQDVQRSLEPRNRDKFTQVVCPASAVSEDAVAQNLEQTIPAVKRCLLKPCLAPCATLHGCEHTPRRHVSVISLHQARQQVQAPC